MLRIARFGILALALALAGCGGSSGSSGVTGPGGGNGGGGGGGGGASPMSANIDGTAWTADPLANGQGAQLTAPGLYLLEGLRTGGTASYLLLTLYNIGGPGTYPLGVSGTTFGGIGSVGDAMHGWNTPLSGAAGTVTITALTATRIAGAFSFTAKAAVGSATGTRTVTEGAFDFPVYGSAGPLPDNAGSRLRCTIDGVPWNGATVVEASSGSGASTSNVLGANNDSRQFSFALTGTLPAGTDFPLSNLPPLTMILTSTISPSLSWGGSVSVENGTTLVTNDTGVVHVTSHTATRLRGTFSGTLAPSNANGGPAPIVITDGEFDIGIGVAGAPAAAPVAAAPTRR